MVIVLLTVALIGYLTEMSGVPDSPPLPSYRAYHATWWNLGSGATPGEVVRVLLITCAALILFATVWEFLRPSIEGRTKRLRTKRRGRHRQRWFKNTDRYRGKRRRRRHPGTIPTTPRGRQTEGGYQW